MRGFGIVCEIRIDHRSRQALNARMENRRSHDDGLTDQPGDLGRFGKRQR
jgi:hypothetical protein